MIVDKFLQALQAGEIINDPEKWKNRQSVMGAIVALISGIVAFLKVFGVELHLSNDMIGAIAFVGAIFLGAANTILTIITTRKIGLKPKGELEK